MRHQANVMTRRARPRAVKLVARPPVRAGGGGAVLPPALWLELFAGVAWLG